MRRISLVLIGLTLGVLLLPGQSWAACPEDPNDNGVCDTLYVEKYSGDETVYPPAPWFVRFAIRVTNDIPDSAVDSIAGLVIPLCYSWSGAGYCSLSGYWNNTNTYPFPDLERSIFRHLPSMDDPQERNFMMDYAEQGTGVDWDTRILDLFDQVSTFRLSLVPTGTQDQKFPGGSRVLVATMTFKVEMSGLTCDYLTIDSCFWPPTGTLLFSRSDAQIYVPRHFLPATRGIGIPWGSIECPSPDIRNSNGTFQSEDKFRAYVDDCGVVSWVYANWDPLPPGISDADVVFTTGPGTRYAEGHVVYTVEDHCQGGGTIRLHLTNNVINGPVDDCEFEVILLEAPPVMSLPETVLVHAGNDVSMEVSATDANADPVEIVLDGFWYEPDSLQPPTNEPYYDGENPGLFSWLTAEADTGAWTCLISATDICGAADVEQVTIRVGVPFCGEANGDGYLDLGDLVFLIGFLYKGGQPPNPLCKGDANCDGVTDIGDLVTLINYLYKRGTAPCFECCAGG